MGAPSGWLPQSEVLTSDPARAPQLDGVSQQAHGSLDTRYPTVPLLQTLLVLEIHRLATGFAEALVKLELERDHLIEAQSLEEHLRQQGVTITDLPGHRRGGTSNIITHNSSTD
jgi:hypothetical protein